MYELPGYTDLRRRRSGRLFSVFSARDTETGRPVMIKLPRQAGPAPRLQAALAHEFEITRQFKAEPSIIDAIALVRSPGVTALVTEDFGGDSLRARLGQPMALVRFCAVALQITAALKHIHAAGVIHKDIKPANIIVSDDLSVVKVADFGSATLLEQESVVPASALRLEGSLPYMSPEQTGRMNRTIDYRSDFYSLGVTFYEMLTGELPFDSSDPIELIHCHIARNPTHPETLNDAIPPSLSRIVRKLMSKQVEERYQSLRGLESDLRRCLDEPQLQPGAHDISERFVLPQKLYGRTEERHRLIQAVEEARSGGVTAVMVRGFSGIGKSALVGEVRRPIAARGWFITGKFDQFQRDIPYSALSQAFAELARRILTEPDSFIAAWRLRLRRALGNCGREITRFVPEMELVLGPQPPLPPLGPAEAQQRFRQTVRSFVKALCQPGAPLVIFVDDLQWADAASLSLLELLLTDAEVSGLLFIGAYRDNEVTPGHPLTITLDRISPADIALGPLSHGDTHALVSETLRRSDCRALSRLVQEKTYGNPFFVREFLDSLHSKGLLRLNNISGRWEWAISEIRAESITDNVVVLLTERLSRLPDWTRRVLRMAACIGARFELGTLALVCEEAPARVARDLLEALRVGLVIPMDSDWKFTGQLDTAHLVYRFRHDRIQQAAYELVPPESRPALHWRIGRLLLARGRDAHIFETVSHLNTGIPTITDVAHRVELADLNLAAARRALRSTAYRSALSHLDTALGLLPDDAWQVHHALTFQLHLARAEAAYLSIEFEEMEKTVAVALAHADSVLERVSVHEVQIQAYGHRMQYRELLALGCEVLALLGEGLPAQPTEADVGTWLTRTAALIGDRTPDDLDSLPDMTDPARLAAMRTLAPMVPAVYFVDPMLHPILISKMVQLTLESGTTPVSAVGFVVYGLVQVIHFGDVDRAYGFGRLALRTVERYEAAPLRASVWFLHSTFIRHWKEPLADCAEQLLEATRAGLEHGDLEYYSYACVVHAMIQLARGVPLEEVREVIARFSTETERLELGKSVSIFSFLDNAVAALQGGLPALSDPDGPASEDATFQAAIDAGDRNLAAHRIIFQLMRRYLGGHLDAALESVALGDPLFITISGQAHAVIYSYFRALTLLASVARDGDTDGRLAQAEEALGAFERYAASAPMNYAHKHLLLRAEAHRACGDALAALSGYEEAAASAEAVGALGDAGLACALAGRHHLQAGRRISARAHLQAACTAWTQWGADGLVEALREAHPDILAAPTAAGDLGHSASSDEVTVRLDLETVTRAGRHIAEAIRLPDLLSRLMTLVLENAGASRAVLLISNGERLAVAAAADGDRVRLDPSRVPYCRAIVRFVTRTLKPVVLQDAITDTLFGAEPDILARRPRSVLCAPLLNQGLLVGVLYLENELVDGAFTRERVRLVGLMASQAAVALENARLYERQIALTAAQQRFVPGQFLESLGHQHITEVAIGDHVEREMSVLFCDIRGFTTLSEAIGPARSMALINEYLTYMEPAINTHGGFIDNYIGDAIMALFSEADQAVAAAVAMQEALRRYNRARRERGEVAIQAGVGINTGRLILGTIGVKDRLRCSVIGDSVNLAARIEGLTRFYGASVLITDATRSRLRSAVLTRPVDRVSVKGREEALQIHEVIDAAPRAGRSLHRVTRPWLIEAFQHYYAAEFEQAHAGFLRCREAAPDDPLPQLFARRCQVLLLKSVSEDWAATGWDGIYRFSHK